jgi:hypothetical protein
VIYGGGLKIRPPVPTTNVEEIQPDLVDLSLLSRHSLDSVLGQLLLLLLGVLLGNGSQVVMTDVVTTFIVVPCSIQTLGKRDK